ncbi:MAG: hypothetical protein WBW57_19560, partial [Candidatus Sulfotelmatobacter sp.]
RQCECAYFFCSADGSQPASGTFEGDRSSGAGNISETILLQLHISRQEMGIYVRSNPETV